MTGVFLLPLAFAAAITVKRSVIKGVIVFNVFLFMITEILSLFHKLVPLYILPVWILFIGICFIVAIKDRHVSVHKSEGYDKTQPGKTAIRKPEFSDLVFLIPAVFSAVLIFPALYTVPYNIDSMCYHLPRIMFWIQNRSVDYYVTGDIRQLVSSPFTEYVQMHTMLLGGDDSFFNMVSFFAGITSIYLICSLVLKITASKAAAVFSGLLYVTTPVIESEMISTQVDVMAGMWVIVCVSNIYDLAQDKELKCDKKGMIRIIFLGCSMGLLFVTKTNACIPVAVMLVWLVIKRVLNKDRFKDIVSYILICGVSAVVFAVPSFIRNYCLSGDILASDYMGEIAVGSLLPAFLIVNALKNVVMAGVLSNVPDNPIRSFQIMIVKGAGKVLGVDVNDPKISFVTGETAFQDNTGLSYEHDHAGAQFLLILFMVLVILFFIYCIRKRSADLFMIFLIIQSVVVFMAVRWQPWVGRLLIPTFVLMIIFSGCMAGRICAENKKAFILIGLISIAVSSFVYVRSYSYNIKPTLLNIDGKNTKNQLYYYNYGFEDGIADNSEIICKKALECGKDEVNAIGLAAGTFVYPDLRILMTDGTKVENINPEWVVEGFHPECIVAIDQNIGINDDLDYNGNKYICEYSMEDGRYSLLKRK